jgi:hypothetical protein
MKNIVIAACFICILFSTGCRQEQPQSGSVQLTKEPSVAGMVWSRPQRWEKAANRPMRAATYNIPASEGDAEGGECAVFYFGTGQGGDVNLNIERWAAQFEPAEQVVKTTQQVAGMKVTRVQIDGAYLAPAGPMMQSQGKKENYRLLGAIVEAPEGSVFFKCTGPANTISTATPEFDAMVSSAAKE